jgi:hypothetical protein
MDDVASGCWKVRDADATVGPAVPYDTMSLAVVWEPPQWLCVCVMREELDNSVWYCVLFALILST